MSRPRKAMAASTGDRSKIIQMDRQKDEVMVHHPSHQLTRPPADLINEEARKEWKRIIPQLKDINIIGNLDKGNIVGYCNAWGMYLEAVRERDDGGILKYGKEFRTFGGKIGMDPDSRLKFAAANREKTEEKMAEEFGAI